MAKTNDNNDSTHRTGDMQYQTGDPLTKKRQGQDTKKDSEGDRDNELR
ncbi:MAG: hypothetical protein LBV08_06860 [Clostridiales bacterium]|nr:hypothetical protein [Clostridiales bacterium]